jgi:hypothetical protein
MQAKVYKVVSASQPDYVFYRIYSDFEHGKNPFCINP